MAVRKINQRALKVPQLMRCHQDGIAKDEVAGKDIMAHIFEYTSTVVSEYGEVSQGSTPVQILFCLNEQNQKKLNSHQWFFNTFGPLIKPNVCIVLDVGSKPTRTSIYKLRKCFHKHPGIGGACHWPELLPPSHFSSCRFPKLCIQHVQHPQQPLESVFGYISVSSSAFSAYWYKALLGKLLQMFAIMNILVTCSLISNQYVDPIAIGALKRKHCMVYVVRLCFKLGFFCLYFVKPKCRSLKETAALFNGEEAIKEWEQCAADDLAPGTPSHENFDRKRKYIHA